MAELDATAAAARQLETRKFSDVSKGYTVFRNGDVLAAKITPCWENGKVGQALLDHPIGVGSTEFHVLRPGPELDDRYLLHFLRQPTVRRAGELRMTGSAGQKRVPPAFLQTLQVPLLPLPEQRRIAAILDHADALRTKRRQVLTHLDALAAAIYEATFGGTELPVVQLGDIATFFGGASLPTGQDFSGQTSGVLLMKVSDMNAVGNEQMISSTALWTGSNTPRSSTVEAGAVVLPKRGASIATNKKRVTVRRTALDPNLMGIQPDPAMLTTPYLFAWFRSFDLTSITSGSAVPQLNKQDLAPLSIRLPPLRLQREFGSKLKQLASHATVCQRTLAAADGLFASLQSRAFRGEL
ncbi:MAG: restriction endonuclease subunit S [Nocardioides sp.]